MPVPGIASGPDDSTTRRVALSDESIAAIAEQVAAESGVTEAVGATLSHLGNASYAAGDLIAQSATAASCSGVAIQAARANDKTGMIRRVRLKCNDITPFLNATIRVHLFKDAPTFANGDNAAFAGGLSESNYLGAMDVILDRQFSDFVKGIGVPNTGTEINFEPSAGTRNVYAVLETRTAITSAGASKAFTIVLEVLQN